MFSNHKTFLRLTCVGGLFTLVAACAQPTTPTPIRADIYLPKYSPAESEFCQMDIGSLSAAQVAEIRNDPNYDANLARWLEECPETALAFADLATASTATGPRTPGGKSGPRGGGGTGVKDKPDVKKPDITKPDPKDPKKKKYKKKKDHKSNKKDHKSNKKDHKSNKKDNKGKDGNRRSNRGNSGGTPKET